MDGHPVCTSPIRPGVTSAPAIPGHVGRPTHAFPIGLGTSAVRRGRQPPVFPEEVQSMATATMNEPRSRNVQNRRPEHTEGTVARTIEQQTAKLPSDLFLWAAGASIVGSLVCKMSGKDHDALFIGQWAPTFLILGLYNKLVKVAGSDPVQIGR
jgi:hypothetical protein